MEAHAITVLSVLCLIGLALIAGAMSLAYITWESKRKEVKKLTLAEEAAFEITPQFKDDVLNVGRPDHAPGQPPMKMRTMSWYRLRPNKDDLKDCL